MKAIWKFMLPLPGAIDFISAPRGARFVHAGLDPNNVPCVWAIVDPDQPKAARGIAVVGTGQSFDPDADGLAYVSTFRSPGGHFIWHVFAEPFEEESHAHRHGSSEDPRA